MHNLVIQTAFLGDLLLSLPLLKRLKVLYPESQTTLICRRGLGPLLGSFGIVDHVYEVNKSDAASYNEVAAKLSDTQFDTLISPHMSFRTALFTRKFSANKKIGFKHPLSFLFYGSTVKRPMHLPDALRQLSLLGPIDPELNTSLTDLGEEHWNSNTEKALEDRLAIPEWASMSVASSVEQRSLTVDLPNNFIAVAPGSVWPTKRWPKDSFQLLIQRLQDMNFKVVLLGGAAEAELCEGLAKSTSALSLAGRTNLIESMRVLTEARLLISNDSGPQHMAAAVDTPVLSLFGPTTTALGYRPWIAKSDIAQIELSCRPCGKHGAVKCPIGTHECMKGLSVDQVLQQAQRLLVG